MDTEAMQTQRKINGLQKQYYQFCDRAGLEPQMERARVKGYRQISTQWLDFDESGGIISRNFAMGLRKSPFHVLTQKEIETILEEAESIGVDAQVLSFNRGMQTGFSDKAKIIFVRGDVFPDGKAVKARDRMPSRAVLAHEYYGHFMQYPSPLKVGSWQDEFNASYAAAVNTPNLTREERRDLMVDAYDRASEAGENKKLTKEARDIIYGY